MLRIGHRGACGYEPENTLASFRKALELKVDMIELDVYVCRSGELVVIHDDKVDRTTNGKGYVVGKPLEELRSLDAGNGERIPLLTEVLDLINGQTNVNIELKGPHTAKPVELVIKDCIQKKEWDEKKFLFSSFDHRELLKLKKIRPSLHIGMLYVGIPYDFAKTAEKLGAYSINISQEFITQDFVDDAHARELKVFVYTVNDVDDIQRISDFGVDGIFSNYPDRLLTQ